MFAFVIELVLSLVGEIVVDLLLALPVPTWVGRAVRWAATGPCMAASWIVTAFGASRVAGTSASVGVCIAVAAGAALSAVLLAAWIEARALARTPRSR